MFDRLYTAIVATLVGIIWTIDFGPSIHKLFLAPQLGNFRVFLGKVRAVRRISISPSDECLPTRIIWCKQSVHGPRITARGASLRDVPEMDKSSYIKQYYLTEKLIDGVLPKSRRHAGRIIW